MRYGTLLLLPLLLGGCQLGYYAHLVGGHLDLMRQRQPVSEVLANDDVPLDVAEKLRLSVELRHFAEHRLQLPAGEAYSDYVALDRDWATWNLLAAPRFSLEPHTWCYPVAGCASYRGYFDRDRAARERRALQERGLEVYEAGSSAYSTLGWFADPLLSTMMEGDEWQFAELLFHELVHRRLYVADDTRFNESLATAVAREGVRRWLQLTAPSHAGEVQQLLARRDQARDIVVALVHDARERLQRVYDAPLDAREKVDLSRALRWQLRARFLAALRDETALAGYRAWFEGPLNNAQLNTLADYEGWVPAFERLMRACSGGLDCFWSEVEALAGMPAGERREHMQELMEMADGDT